MSQNKEINFSVNDKDLRGKIGATMDDMIRKSRQYTNSSKEVTRDLKEQISYLEKKARLEKDMSLFKARELREYGGLKEQREANFIASSANDKYKNDRLIINLLKEQLDAINATSKNEIRENRNEVSKIVEADKSLNRLGVKGDPAENYKRLLQRDILGQLGKEEQEEKSTFQRYKKFGKDGGEVFNKASNVAVSRNEMYAVAAAVSLMPWIGQGLGNIANRLFSSAEGIAKGKETRAVLERTSISDINSRDIAGRAKDIGKYYGMNAQDIIDRENAYIMASKRSQSDLYGLIGAERKLGLSQGDITSLYGATRHTKGVMVGGEAYPDIQVAIANMNKYLRESNQNQAVLPELLNSYKTIASQISQSGYVNNDELSLRLTGIAGASGLTGQHLDRLLTGVGGLANTKNPLMRGMMMESFRKQNPNASLWEIQTMMESPFEWYNLDAMSGFMKDFEKRTGGGDYYKQALYTLFSESGLNRRDVDNILSGGKSLGDVLGAKGSNADTWTELHAGAEEKVSEMTESQKKFDAFFQKWGDKAAELTDKMIDKMTEGMDMLFGDGAEDKQRAAEEAHYKRLETAVTKGIKEGMKNKTY